jgi:ABC-2 type transport system permease protein
MMHNTFAISRRELSSFLNAPIAFVVALLFLGVTGFFQFGPLFLPGGTAEMRTFFFWGGVMFVILMPLMTMRLVAEERAQGTIEVLLAMPISDWQVVLGKYLASLGMVAVLLLLSTPFAYSIAKLGPLDKGATFAGYVGLFLFGAAYSAIGLMCSAFTRSQILAAVIALIVGGFLFVIGFVTQLMPPWLATICHGLGSEVHFQNIQRGVLDTRDLVYYLSLSVGSLVIAEAALESRRWR